MSAPTVVLWSTGGAAVDGERRAGVVAPYKVRGSENIAGRISACAIRGRGGINMTIGEAVRLRILELCREHGDISLNKLCTISGVTQSTVNNVMSGRNNSVTVSTVKKLCDGLNITVTEFFTSTLFSDLEQEIK